MDLLETHAKRRHAKSLQQIATQFRNVGLDTKRPDAWTSVFPPDTTVAVDDNDVEDNDKKQAFDTRISLSGDRKDDEAFARELAAWQSGFNATERLTMEFWTWSGDGPLQTIAKARAARNGLKGTDLRKMLHYLRTKSVHTQSPLVNYLIKGEDGRGLLMLRKLNTLEMVLHRTLLRSPRTPHDTILWRGLTNVDRDALASDRRILVTRSPQSWSRSPLAAHAFIKRPDRGVLIALLVPRGTRLADLWLRPQPSSSHKKDPGIGLLSELEKEIVLPRGSRVRVVAAYAPRPGQSVTALFCLPPGTRVQIGRVDNQPTYTTLEDDTCLREKQDMSRTPMIVIRLLPSSSSPLDNDISPIEQSTTTDFVRPYRRTRSTPTPSRQRRSSRKKSA